MFFIIISAVDIHRLIFSPHLITSALSQIGLGLRTPARTRTPRGLERNKENVSQLNGALRTMTSSPYRNCSINSVASSYTEFAVISLSFYCPQHSVQLHREVKKGNITIEERQWHDWLRVFNQGVFNQEIRL